MHWAYELAQQIINAHPDQEQYTCASGVSPSGFIHVGNFREVATTFFVTQALVDLGKQPHYILSWDDYDRLRKIPLNVKGVSEDAIGMPYTKIDNPYGTGSYGGHFEQLFEKSLAKLGIAPHYIYETEMYESGAYDALLIKALANRKEIYDIIAKYRTEAPDAAEREQYYPISLYCDTCGHDMTTIEHYDDATHQLSYTCKFGHHGVQTIGDHQRIKLHWKIDWPMRWRYEQVVFEPGGKDHSSKNGSFDVATEIAAKIFDYQAPIYEPYDFVNIKGQNAKMSSSTGNIITLDELLAVYTPELVLYLYAKYQPRAQFDLALDGDVLRNYDEFARLAAEVKAGTAAEALTQILHLTGVDLSKNYPAFSHAVSILSLTSLNQDLTKQLLLQEDDYTDDELQHILPRAAYWLENYAPERILQVNTTANTAYYQQLSPEVKEALTRFVQLVQQSAGLSDQELMQKIYDLSPATDKKEKRTQQHRLFQAIYQLTLNQDSGPRIPLLIKIIGKDQIVKLLQG